MTFSSLFRVFACLFALFAIALLSSCGDNPCESEDKPDYSRETPEKLLKHLAESFNNKRVDWYSECLDEDFVFVLTDRDADSLGLPEAAPWLERSEDTTAVGRMFRYEYMNRIRFSFSAIPASVEGDEEGTLVFRTSQDILVEIRCPERDPITYSSQDSWFDFVVAQDPVNDDLWVIRSMAEIPMNPGLAGSGGPAESAGGACLATPQSTLGYIKSVFLKAPAKKRIVDEALEGYIGSIATEDIGLYGDCLDFDHRFIFTDDIADTLHLPPDAPWWTRSEDREALTAMFENPSVTIIGFDYDVVSRDTSWVNGKTIVGIRIRPDILVRYEASGEEPIHFLVQDELMDFEFVGRGPCLDRWTVLSVEDIPIHPIHWGRDKSVGQAFTMSMTWGGD